MNRKQKCPDCGVWNENQNHCSSCGVLLNRTMRLEKEDLARRKEIEDRPPDALDRFVESMKNSRWWLVKGLYYIGFSVYMVFVAIASLFMFMMAWGPG